MADGFKTEIDQTKEAAAILAACIVRTLNESDPTFSERFDMHLRAMYSVVSERGESHAMETLTWVGQILRSEHLT
jgi:hypothetical protein